MKNGEKGSICVFLALSLLLIVSLIVTCLEAARYSASESYARILLKTATESVLAEYYGPLFEDYHIFAVDTGYGNKSGNTDEMETKMMEYFLDNVWDFEPERVNVTGTERLFNDGGREFLEQAAAYEKYSAASSLADEILDRVKALGDQDKLKKVLKKRLDIEDELSVIDKYTVELMRLIDGVDMNLKISADSLEVYRISPNFIKKFFVKEPDSTTVAINNPGVFEKLKDYYVNPIPVLKELRNTLPDYALAVQDRIDCETIIDYLENELGELLQKKSDAEDRLGELNRLIEKDSEKIEQIEKKLDSLSKKKNMTAKEIAAETEKRTAEKEKLENSLTEKNGQAVLLLEDINGYNKRENELDSELDGLYVSLEEYQAEEKRLQDICDEKAALLYNLCTNVTSELWEVISIITKISEKQDKARPLVEGYEGLVNTVKPLLSDEVSAGLTDSLDLMKAYVGLDNERLDITDFAGIMETAQYDYKLMTGFNSEIFCFRNERNYENIMEMFTQTEGLEETFSRFSYTHFVFDYSKLKEKPIENEIAAEFEENVADGYLSLFLEDTSVLSDSKLICELLPSLWFETGADEAEDADSVTEGASDKSGSELLDGADEGSCLSELSELLESGVDTAGTGILSALYMNDHFKSYRESSSVGDTVLEYELEYILSGLESDSANLAAAATKILLIRMMVTVIYTMTDSECKAQAEAVAMAAMGFTGMPFLVTLVKYLILFLWGTAQAVIETAAVLRGKKVPVLTGSDSFCLTLPELAVFPALISEKAENMKESQLYLDYNNYLFILLLLENSEKKAARAMDLIQENIRYKYNEDFLLNNAITGFSAEAEFSVQARYSEIAVSLLGDGNGAYAIKVEDTVAY